MPGVGKLARVILLLVLCTPAAVHVSRRSPFAGQPFGFSGFVMRVCHERLAPRGTHRQNQPLENEPLNALWEQERSNSSCGPLRSSISAAAITLSQFKARYQAAHRSGPIPDPALLCSFLI